MTWNVNLPNIVKTFFSLYVFLYLIPINNRSDYTLSDYQKRPFHYVEYFNRILTKKVIGIPIREYHLK
mgnify:CR=1 FL=1